MGDTQTVAQPLPDDPQIEYVRSSLSIRKLAKLYSGRNGCSATNLRYRQQKEKWIEKRRQFREDVARKSIEEAVEGEVERTARQLKNIRSTQELGLAGLAGLAHKITAIGGPAHFFDDPKLARSLAIVLRACDLVMRGTIYAERQVIGKRREEMEDILKAANQAMKDLEAKAEPPKPNGKPQASAPAPEAVTEGANGGST